MAGHVQIFFAGYIVFGFSGELAWLLLGRGVVYSTP